MMSASLQKLKAAKSRNQTTMKVAAGQVCMCGYVRVYVLQVCLNVCIYLCVC